MGRRFKMGRRRSRKLFSRTASLTHRKNVVQGGQMAMRGGIRA